jgi:NADP-dependent alcohol dehydrogenase
LNCVDFTATGNEFGAVVTIEATKEKTDIGGSALFPKFLQTILDATHVMEQYLTYPHEGYLQDRIAEDTTNLN